MASYSKSAKTVIKLIGIGGAGCNAITNIYETVGEKIKNHTSKEDIESSIIAMNTDQQSLQEAVTECKVQLGSEGRGAGSNEQEGRAAAEYSIEDIKKVLQGSTLIIIFAGLGGGTGSGATPTVARIAKEMGILVIVLCTKPFSFEGRFRMSIAQKALAELETAADLTVVLSNDLLYSVTNEQTPLVDAFKYMDEFVKNFVVAIMDALLQTGLVNVDFADMKMIIEEKGMGIVGIGEGEGEEAASKAVQMALQNPILDQRDIKGSSGAMVYIAGTRNIGLVDVNKIVSTVYESLDNNEAKVIYGSSLYNNSIGEDVFIRDIEDDEKKIKVLIIITGLKDNKHAHINDDKPINILSNKKPEQLIDKSINDHELFETVNHSKDIKEKSIKDNTVDSLKFTDVDIEDQDEDNKKESGIFNYFIKNIF